jgi:uncharacterized damage-inducible protein DinB
MHRFYVDCVERLQSLHDGIEQALEGLPPEALDWDPAADMNSIVVLVVHLTGAERYWIGDVAAGEPSGRDRAAEFMAHGLSAAELRERLAASSAYVRKVLARFTLDDLAKPHTSPRDGRKFSTGWALLHALEHTALHLGHIQITAQSWASRQG